MSEMAYRENFWTWAIIHSVWLLTMILFFKIVFQGTVNINGWSEYQTLLVLGTGTLITGLGSLTFFPFMYNFGKDIQKGDLDAKSTKPLDIHFQSAFHWIDTEDLIVVPNSLVLIAYATFKLNPPHLALNIIGYTLLLISSLVILFSVLTLIQSLALKFIKVDTVANFYWSVVNIGKYPAKAIKSVSVLASILLIPIAVISSVPAEVLFGRYEPQWIIGSFVSALVLLWFSRWVFMSSLRHYSSASS